MMHTTGCSEIIVSYIKVRLAQCVRKLGRVKEAIKIYREVCSSSLTIPYLSNIISKLLQLVPVTFGSHELILIDGMEFVTRSK